MFNRTYKLILVVALALYVQMNGNADEPRPQNSASPQNSTSSPMPPGSYVLEVPPPATLVAPSGAVIGITEPHKGEYAGNAECQKCHPAEWKVFFKNPHFKSLASGKEPPELTACEGCHGPAKAHILAGGGKKTIPRAFTIMKPAEIISACMNCHAKDYNRANIRRSEHTQHDVACTECHSNHHPTTDKACWPRPSPISAMDAMATWRRSSACHSNTASTRVS
jgi:hypothetical protein